MGNELPPSILLVVGALIVPILKGKVKAVLLLLLPILALVLVLRMPQGRYWTAHVLDYSIVLGRVDKLSLVFGYVFALVVFIGTLFSLKVDDTVQHIAVLTYGGSALGVTFAGDLFSFYVFWELLAVSSTFLILARKTKASQGAALRYVLVHVFGGLCLLAGIIVTVTQSGSIGFDAIGLTGVGGYLIFFGVALNAAVPPLHAWLVDAYPEATVTGAVFMSAITTKTAVYVMARAFPGAELLVWLGCVMAVLPVLYGLVEDDVRRVLSYSIINQGGFMMIGIGIGTSLSLNGAISHAFCSVLYTALLFMAAGSVIQMTGKSHCTELGGLCRTMPMTCVCCIIAGASISALPLTCGFISKSMTISASAHENLPAVWLVLELASVGAFLHAGLKVVFYTFFNRDSGIAAQDPPGNMVLAMGIAGFLCIFLGIFPDILYRILPYPVDYVPYTGSHVVGQLQLVLFSAAVFGFLQARGIELVLPGRIYLDADWFYRIGARWFNGVVDKSLNGLNAVCEDYLARRMSLRFGALSRRPITTLVALYMRKARKDFRAIERLEKGTRPELANLIPTGVPVLLSLAVLFCLIAVFASYTWK